MKRRTREEGVLESINGAGTEFRLYFVGQGRSIVRIPWHCDPLTKEWYEGIFGVPISVEALLRRLATAPLREFVSAVDGVHAAFIGLLQERINQGEPR